MQQRRSNRREGTNEKHNSHGHAGFERTFVYAPNELALIGGSAVGPVVDLLLDVLGREYRVARRTDRVADLPDGDEGSWQSVRRGASPLFFADGERYAVLGSGEPDRWTAGFLMNDADILLVVNDRTPSLAKIAVVDEGSEILEEIERGEAAGIVAFVRSGRLSEKLERRLRTAAGNLPVFDYVDAGPLAGFIVEYLRQRAREVPLYGLVLGGGKSARMKRDKTKIAYHGVPQVRYAYELLQQICNRTFVSIRAEQADDEVFAGLEQVHDRFSQIGPMGGILSALHTHPDAAWLVLGCDLPFVDGDTLRELVSGRDPILQATCFESSHDTLPEPLCAIYEPRYRRRLHQFLAEGRDCPRKALINTHVRRLTLRDPGALDNVNSPQDFERATARIREEGRRAG